MENKKFNLYFAIAIVVFLVVLLIMAASDFIAGFIGAIIMYIFFSPVHDFLVRKKVNKTLAAVIVLLFSLLVILLPFIILSVLIAMNVSNLIGLWQQNPQIISDILSSIDALVAKILPSFNLFSFLQTHISEILGFTKGLAGRVVSGAGVFIVNVLIMYSAFYFMLVQKEDFKKMKNLIPFSSKNSDILIKKFKEMTYAAVLVSGIIAILQGTILGIAFLIFGIKSWLLWGFVAAVLAFIPFIGQLLVWIPAVIIMLAYGNYTAAVGILIAGIILSNIDNVIRPYLQSKMGDMHPLVTLLGVFIGIPLFGIIGIILGPLIISYAFLTLKMLREEYLK